MTAIVDDNTGKSSTEEEVLQDIREMLAGGSDTSANTLTYTLYFLATSPNLCFMKKLVEEIDSKFNEDDVESVRSMIFLEHVLFEAMRLIPAGPLIFRKAVQDDKLGEYFVPKDVRRL